MSLEWLMERVPGFAALSEKERSAISDFVFLWSLFEARIMDNYARANSLEEKVLQWSETGLIGAGDFEHELEYFRNRYFDNGEFTDHFDHLLLRKSDHPELVRSVLDGSNNNPRDHLLAVLMVVWRYRNNLFHGEKWSYQFRGQFANFTHANRILMQILDRHGVWP